MLTYLFRRLLLLVPTLLGVLAVVFFVMALSPGGFGGTALAGDTGTQTEGQDAKRIRKALERRYGLDLPLAAQFARWINQVSPVGFAMSDDVTLDADERAAVADVLKGEPFNTRDTRMARAVDLTQTLAGYLDVAPADAAAQLKAALQKPSEHFELFEAMDVKLDAPAHERLQETLRHLEGEEDRGLERAQNEFIQTLAFEASGRSRVRFDLPCVKWPDLGVTLRGEPVTGKLAETVPITVLLNVLSLPLIYLVAIVSGIYAARRRGGWFDVSSGAAFLGLWSVPTIWAGALLVTYLCNQQYLHWFPAAGLHDLQADRMDFFPSFAQDGFARGYLLDFLWHLVLPVACMTYGGFAVMAKVMRGIMLESLSADYVRTATAKGLSERVVLWRHAFRNSVLPLITMASGILPALFAGSLIVETIFSINGLGKLGLDAAFAKDRELIMATTLMGGLLSLTAELIRDLAYAVADPRVSYE